MANKIVNFFKNNLSIILFFIVWELSARLGLLNTTLIAAPSGIIEGIKSMYYMGTLQDSILISFQRSISGFILAASIGIPLGFLLGGWFKTIEQLLMPLLNFMRNFNPFSLFPVFITLFGISETPKVIIIFWVSLWPIVFNTITGFKEVDGLLIKATKSMGAGKKTILSKVMLPAALPYIFTGLKMAVGTSFFMLLAAEMIGASRGLGWLLNNAQQNYDNKQIWGATVLVSALGIIINTLVKYSERRVITWKDTVAEQ
jgi:NitT/TauT family transport system permease protein